MQDAEGEEMRPIYPIAMIIVFLMALGMFLAAIPSEKRQRDASLTSEMPISCNIYIVELEGHEYYFVQRGISGIALAHKANCKACGKENNKGK
jgi:hypothetical protein